MEADHIAAVSAIVSERKDFWSSSIVGGLWGVGHTISLLIAGVAVLLLQFQISPRLELSLEFCVAIMLIILGVNALRKLINGGTIHMHAHEHGGHHHVHPHIHDNKPEPQAHTHHGFKLGVRPVLVGMVHGLAGSGALMLLILTEISSPVVGLLYILIFGIGSIGGMLLMSAFIGLPVHFTAKNFSRVNWAVRFLAGAFSLVFGLFMVYEIGFVEGLFV
jgi:sulfite exporter TauE/SafE